MKTDQQTTPTQIQQLFNAIAGRYDLMNDLMSFGIHRLWKWRLAHLATRFPGSLAIDLAGGTGDIARLLARNREKVMVVDISPKMMEIGQARLTQQERKIIDWLEADAGDLPFADHSIDLATIAFGLRNMAERGKVLREILRVLKPGGGLVCLEFSHVHPWLRPFYQFYSSFFIPRLGRWITQNPAAYQYLIDSIRQFPDQQELKQQFETAGFKNVQFKNLFFGVACLHWGQADRNDSK